MKVESKFILVIILAVVGFAVSASVGFDDQGNINDPAVNERANACFEGGSLEGKCNTTDIDKDGLIENWEGEGHYTCGWYLIRFEYNLLGEDNLPEGCSYEEISSSNITPPDLDDEPGDNDLG